MDSFVTITAEIERRVRAGERVALIMIDGLGAELLARYEHHPFSRRLALTSLRSQFPATTTAHVTTIHYGLAVEQHGLYEWNILEPSLGEMICPLMFEVAGGRRQDGLTGRLDPRVLAPGPTLYERLAQRSLVVQPHYIGGSQYTLMATRGADRAVFAALADGARLLVNALTGRRGYGYGFLYWDRVDAAGHEHGPDSPQFDAAARCVGRARTGARLRRRRPRLGADRVVCADHARCRSVRAGRLPRRPVAGLPALLSQQRPAGSSRDAFLHVAPGQRQAVIDGLGERLGDRAEVRAAAELFGAIGPTAGAQLADVAVLPAAGRQAWMRSAAAGERWFRGHHGGFDDQEALTYLAELVG